ncbi:hypothetical protein D3C80_1670770 [compost metagenome]
MAGQHRANGLAIAAGQRRLEAGVGGQCLHRTVQLPATPIEQVAEDPRPGVQLLAGLAAHGRLGGGLHGEIQRADHHQQQQDHHTGDARAKTTGQHQASLATDTRRSGADQEGICSC